MISFSFLLNNKILPGIWLQIGNSSPAFPMPPLLAVVEPGSWLLLCLAALLEGETPADTAWEQIADELPRAFRFEFPLALTGPDWMQLLSCVQERWLCAKSPLDSNHKSLWGGGSRYFTRLVGLKTNCLPICLWPACTVTAEYPLSACKWCIFSVLPC